MKQASLFLFGPPRIEREGRVMEVDTRKALALLAYLALEGNRNRDSLAALLYPDYDQTSARGALRRTLSVLRKALGEGILDADRELLALQPGALWVDVLDFRRQLAECRKHGHAASTLCPNCLPQLVKAASIYTSDFMSGFSLRDSAQFDDWQFFQAESLRQELAGGLERLGQLLASSGDYESALGYARRWLTLDPLREEAHCQLMQLYAWSGQRSAALRQYRECVRILEKELGVSPLNETTQLYQAIIENSLPVPSPGYSTIDGLTGSYLPERGSVSSSDSGSQVQGRSDTSSERFNQQLLIGRGDELRELHKAHKAAANVGYLAVLEGEPGIGKTRLAEELSVQVSAAGANVIQGRCYEGESGLAYAPFLDALSAALARPGSSERLSSLPVHVLAAAARLLPTLGSALPTADLGVSQLDAPGSQARFFDALRQVISAMLNGDQPGILWLDDLHWADAASMDLLAYLVRRLSGTLLLLTWRSDEIPADHSLRRILAQSLRENRALRLHLRRLDVESVAEIIQLTQPGKKLPAGFARRLFQESEGNPFFVIEYLEALSENETLASTEEWSLPMNVRDLLRSRISGLDEIGLQLLSAAAVIGRSFDFDCLREVSGRSELEVISGVEDLQRQGLVMEYQQEAAADKASYDFTHDKLRTFVNEETSMARRRLLHLRTAETLAARHRSHRDAVFQASLIANHYQLAGQMQLAGEYFHQAAEHARRLYANREAIAHYKSALACGHPNIAGMHENIADLYALLAEYNAALAHYEAAAASCTPEHQPWLDHKLGLVHHNRGDWELAECYYNEALESLRKTEEPGEQARIYADWSRTALRQGQLERAKEFGRLALELANSSREKLAIGQVHNILGILARARGDLTEAIQHLEQSMQIAEEIDDPGGRAAAFNNLARVHADSGDLQQALSLTDSALQLALQLGDRHRAAALHNNLADLFHALGNADQAMEHLKKAVVIFAEIGDQVSESQQEIWKLVEW